MSQYKEFQVTGDGGRAIRGWTVFALNPVHAREVALRDQDRGGGMGPIGIYELPDEEGGAE